MTEKNLQDSLAQDESIITLKKEADFNYKKPFFAKGIFSYKNTGTQPVINLFGYELTAPSGLKNPGIVYLSFIILNLIIFLTLKTYMSR